MKTSQLADILELVYANNPLAVAIFDMDMRYLFANQQWFIQYQLTGTDIIGKSHYDVFPEIKGMSDFIEIHKRVLNGETHQSEQDRLLRKDGTVQYQRWLMAPWFYPGTDDQGGAYIYTEDITDKVNLVNEKNELISQLQIEITKRKAYQEQLKHQATTDELTGLYNRRYYSELLSSEIKRAERYSEPLSFFLIDVDNFKKINDTYGHSIGDKVLQEISYILQENLRVIDKLCRWGGEEFTVLLPSTTSKKALALAERLREIVETYTFPDVENVTISIGVTSHQQNNTIDTLFKHADEALYKAKRDGRNRVVQYSTGESTEG